MTIEKVSSNSFSVGYQQQKQLRTNPSFTGKSFSNQDFIRDNLYHSNAIKRMKSLKWLKGEIGGILITAVGTGLVAPIFIGFNPFVKAPKNATPEQKQEQNNTKLYTAMRQPISAALAILFQASVQKYIDKGLDIQFNNPQKASKNRINLDQQDINTDTRVQDIIKKQMKQEGKKKPLSILALFSRNAKAKRKEFKDEFNSRVDNFKKTQLENVAQKFRGTGLIYAGDRHMPNNVIADLVNKQIADYISDAEKLKKTPKQIAFYKERAKLLIDNEEFLNKVFAPVEKLVNEEKYLEADKKALEIAENIMMDDDVADDVKVLFKEIKDRPSDLRANRAVRTLTRIKSINNMMDGKNFTKERYQEALNKRNGVLTDKIIALQECIIENVETADEKLIKNTLKKVADVCDIGDAKGKNKDLSPAQRKLMESVLNDTETFSKKSQELLKKVFLDVTKKYKKLVENQYKSWNQFTKIGIGVFITLPITCTALNWVYPRFMELFFPKLAGVKKAAAPQQQTEKVGGDK